MIKINLLSDREAIRKETSRQQVSIFLLSICLLLVVLGGIQFTYSQKKNSVEEQIVAVNRVLAELQTKVGEVEKYKQIKSELEAKLLVIEMLKKGKWWTARLLDNLGETIQEKMWLSKLTLSGNNLGLEGYAIDHETIARFMRDMEASSYFSNVELRLTEGKDVEGVGMKYFSLVTASDPAQQSDAGAGSTAGGDVPGIKSQASP